MGNRLQVKDFDQFDVIDVLKGRDTITTNALEGLKVIEIIEKIYDIK